MLRFFSRFQADFQLKSGWIEPLLVGGYAPFSPVRQTKVISIVKKVLIIVILFCNSTITRRNTHKRHFPNSSFKTSKFRRTGFFISSTGDECNRNELANYKLV